jgi:hypothetical protein
MRTAKLFGAGALAAALLASTGGAAQDRGDPTARYDIDDARHRHPHEVSELPTQEKAAGRPITFDLSLAGVYSTNAGADRSNRVDTGYVTPGFGINVTPVSAAAWDIGGGALIDGDYYSRTKYDDQWGEGRLEGFIFATRPLGPGDFTAEYILLGVFSNDFSDHDFNLGISDLTYSVDGSVLNAEVSAEYQSSNVLRRSRLTAMVGHTLAQPQFGYEITVEGDVAFSDFNGGANQNRNDVVAALTLTADKALGRDWSLEWSAAFINRFSNRDASRFTALELGVEINKAF